MKSHAHINVYFNDLFITIYVLHMRFRIYHNICISLNLIALKPITNHSHSSFHKFTVPKYLYSYGTVFSFKEREILPEWKLLILIGKSIEFAFKGPMYNELVLVEVVAWRRQATSHCINQYSLQRRHNVHEGVSNHPSHHCLLKRLFRWRSKKTSKLRVTSFVRGIHRWPMNCRTKASNAENCSIWWSHHVDHDIRLSRSELISEHFHHILSDLFSERTVHLVHGVPLFHHGCDCANY